MNNPTLYVLTVQAEPGRQVTDARTCSTYTIPESGELIFYVGMTRMPTKREWIHRYNTRDFRKQKEAGIKPRQWGIYAFLFHNGFTAEQVVMKRIAVCDCHFNPKTTSPEETALIKELLAVGLPIQNQKMVA